MLPELADAETPAEESFVYVKAMSGTERGLWEKRLNAGRKKGDPPNYERYYAQLVAATACDGAGVLLFSEADIPDIGAQSVKALMRIVEAGERLNGLTEEDRRNL